MSSKSTHVRSLVLALLLTASFGATMAQTTRSANASTTIGVAVEDGEIRVSTDNATVPPNVNTITWRLNTPGWRFVDGSINFGEANAAFTCKLFNEGQVISCVRGFQAPKGALAYRISLSDGRALAELPQPTIWISLD
jgi:hypothetical protein